MRTPLALLGTFGLIVALASPTHATVNGTYGTVTEDAPSEFTTTIGLTGEGFFAAGTNPLTNCTFGWSKTGPETIKIAEPINGINKLTEVTLSGTRSSPDLFNIALCPNENLYRVWPATDGVPASLGPPLALSAAARLQIPFPNAQSSPPGTADWPHITQLQVWYWIDQDIWQPITSRASLNEVGGPADVWIEVTATPIESIWDPGDGATPLVCERGLEWTEGLKDHESPCHHTYTTKPPKGEASAMTAFAMTVGIRWQISIRCSHPAMCAGISPIGDQIGQSEQEAWITSVTPVITR